ncbi:hypothetical protein V8G54_026232 [Vigna mungo]|uniref:Uncharacterized protein n=1 Tax=Vigna mungo TaxID=3915 RepID=A0AAQ3N027_VIGMU
MTARHSSTKITRAVKMGNSVRSVPVPTGWSLSEPTQPDSFISESEKFEPGSTHHRLAQAGEFVLKAEELLKMRETITNVISDDMERDVLMSAAEAQAHGIVDLLKWRLEVVKKEKYRYEDIYIGYENPKGKIRIWISDAVSVGCRQSMEKDGWREWSVHMSEERRVEEEKIMRRSCENVTYLGGGVCVAVFNFRLMASRTCEKIRKEKRELYSQKPSQPITSATLNSYTTHSCFSSSLPSSANGGIVSEKGKQTCRMKHPFFKVRNGVTKYMLKVN